MSARELVLGRVRAAVVALPHKRPLPELPANLSLAVMPGTASAVDRFRDRLQAVNGRVFTETRALGAWLLERRARRGFCDPALTRELSPALGTDLVLETRLDRGRLDDYAFGITRASGAIAETGTLILTDAGTPSRLAALGPWIHVAVLRAADIHATVADALAALGDDPNVVWCTGPSKTADVEGIMIEGVHGPGEQVALILS